MRIRITNNVNLLNFDRAYTGVKAYENQSAAGSLEIIKEQKPGEQDENKPTQTYHIIQPRVGGLVDVVV